jgi:RNA polymerase sigma-70 factor (ECF subfamily)
MTSGSTALIPSMTAIEPRPVVAERSAMESDLEGLHAESWGWALSCCARDRDLAEDVLQTAYLRILSGRARFSGKSSFKTWVFGVIRMIARSEKRRAWLWNSRHRRSDAALDVPDSASRADANVEGAERAERLASALGRLSDRQREVLQLAFYHDLTIEDAARVMEVSVGSARTHYDRGKKALARLLTAEEVC